MNQGFQYAYLIFVISFARAKFLENKIYTKKRVNYDKLHRKLPIFCVKSLKNDTMQFFFYTDTVCGVCDKYEECLETEDGDDDEEDEDDNDGKESRYPKMT